MNLRLLKPFVCALCILASAQGSSTAQSQTVTNWISIFNGNKIDGWKQENAGTFVATNGVLHVSGGKGWLRTERTFTNFIFEAEWRGLETNFNSGFFIRAEPDGTPWPTNVWQINLKQSAVGELLRGSTKIVPATTPAASLNEWVKFRIEARDKTLTLDVNGGRAWEFQDFQPTFGHIGIQAEGKTFEFRNLRILE